MVNKYSNASYETIYNGLITGKIQVSALSVNIATHRQAVVKYVQDKPSVLKTFKSAEEEKFLKGIVEKSPKYFIYLNTEQYTNFLADTYFEYRISCSENVPETFLTKSYDKNLVLNLEYETCDGEEIIYFDKDLETTTFLFTKLNVAFKVIDSIKFFKYVDVAVESIGYNSVNQALTYLVLKTFQKILIKLVNVDKFGIYTLNSMHDEIESAILSALNAELNNNGIVVEKINIRKLAVSNATSKIIEKQDLEILSVKKKKKADAEYEKIALENYAKKAEIHTANPNYEVGLTEAEKDLALERYIKKVNFEHGIVDDLPTETYLSKRVDASDVEVKKATDKQVAVAEEPKSTNQSVIFYVLAAIAFFVLLVTPLGTGGTIIVVGLIAAFLGIGISISLSKKDNKATTTTTQTVTPTETVDVAEITDTNDKVGETDNE